MDATAWRLEVKELWESMSRFLAVRLCGRCCCLAMERTPFGGSVCVSCQNVIILPAL